MAADSELDLSGRLRRAVMQARKDRDAAAVRAFQSALGALDNAGAVPVEHASTSEGSAIAGAVSGVGSTEAERRALSDAEMVAIVQAGVDDRLHAAEEYERSGEVGRAAELRAEADALRRLLPPA